MQPASSVIDANLAATLVGAIGEPDMANVVLHWLNATLLVDHCSFVRFDREYLATSVAASVQPTSPALIAHDLYRHQYYKYDRTYRILHDIPADQRHTIYCQSAGDIAHTDYRRLCYDAVGIGERLSLMPCGDSRGAIVLHLYRNHTRRSFNDADISAITELWSFLTELVAKHFEMLALSEPAVTRYRKALSHYELSSRERDVCSRILAGMSAKEIAKELALSEATVVTYRKRAYQRLGVASSRDLHRYTTESANLLG